MPGTLPELAVLDKEKLKSVVLLMSAAASWKSTSSRSWVLTDSWWSTLRESYKSQVVAIVAKCKEIVLHQKKSKPAFKLSPGVNFPQGMNSI